MQLCRAAWTLFQEIEKAGGAAAALEAGLIQNKVAADAHGARRSGRARARIRSPAPASFPHLARTPVAGARRAAQSTLPRYPASIKFAPLPLHPPRRAVRSTARCIRRDAGQDRRAAESLSRQSRHARRLHRARDLRQELLRGRRHRGGRNDGFAGRDDHARGVQSVRRRRSPACARPTRSMRAKRSRPRKRIDGGRRAAISISPAGRASWKPRSTRPASRSSSTRLRRAGDCCRRAHDCCWKRP